MANVTASWAGVGTFDQLRITYQAADGSSHSGTLREQGTQGTSNVELAVDAAMWDDPTAEASGWSFEFFLEGNGRFDVDITIDILG